MKKSFEPNTFETDIYLRWEQNNFFKPSGKGDPYCIMLPPPNVTGSLHMGHGFQHTLMDALIRYHRMRGYNTLWQAGVDHAGISTQMVVERQLLTEGKTRFDLGRDAFVKRVWSWKEESGDRIIQQMRRLGASPDWTRACFTMDATREKAVLTAFNRLYDEGLIYRGVALVNWDPVLHTAISDLEVINTEEQGSLWYIRYPLTDDSGYVVVATTRPETMLADTAVAVNPDDERYLSLIGKFVKLPLTERIIPIIADASIDKTFGTGCVKITPAHDFNDYALGKKHHLEQINILNPDATLNELAPKKYCGLSRFKAREQIITDLKSAGLLEKIEPHLLKIPRGDRTNEIIEPYLTNQWFIRMATLAAPAIAAVEAKHIRFVPENWQNTYFQWMHNIQDWCISRQLWWGHRIPAWYDADGKVYVGFDEQSVRTKYQLAKDIILTQDQDVLDTWFSSALWPLATLGWPESTKELQIFYPTNVLVTGFDIIFFWVARMIMFGLHFGNAIPFHEIYITGLIRDQDGQKMSKTKGNVIDPLDLVDGISLADLIAKRTTGLMQPKMAKRIETETKKQFPEGIAAYGVDALRMTFCSLAGTGRDVRFDLGRLDGYKNFCNKLWNATRYTLMQTEGCSCTSKTFTAASTVDKWIISRLQTIIQTTDELFKVYRFDLLAQTLYDFIWHEFCDWYLELSKPILANPDVAIEAKEQTKNTLLLVLETILRLLHPIMPFVTEALWQSLAPRLDFTSRQELSIMIQSFPAFDIKLCDKAAENTITFIQALILSIRNIRGEMVIAPNVLLPLYWRKGTAEDHKLIIANKSLIQSLAKLQSIEPLESNSPPPLSATAIIGQLEILIPLEGTFDAKTEIDRLQKEIEKLAKELQKAQIKLTNPQFIEKAPADIVAKERLRAQETEHQLEGLKKQLVKMQEFVK